MCAHLPLCFRAQFLGFLSFCLCFCLCSCVLCWGVGETRSWHPIDVGLVASIASPSAPPVGCFNPAIGHPPLLPKFRQSNMHGLAGECPRGNGGTPILFEGAYRERRPRSNAPRHRQRRAHLDTDGTVAQRGGVDCARNVAWKLPSVTMLTLGGKAQANLACLRASEVGRGGFPSAGL